MILQKSFSTYNRTTFLWYFVIMIVLLIGFILASFFIYNGYYRTLKDDIIIEGNLSDKYYTQLRKEGQGYDYEWKNYLVLVVDDSIRLAFPVNIYKDYLPAIDSFVYPSVLIKSYIDSTMNYCFIDNEKQDTSFYYLLPDQLESAELAIQWEGKDYDMSHINMALANGDSTMLAGAPTYEKYSIYIPEGERIHKYNRLGYISIVVPFSIFCFILIGLVNYNNQTFISDVTENIKSGDKTSFLIDCIFLIPLFCYTTYGLYTHSLFIPGNHGGGIYFHGLTLWLLQATTTSLLLRAIFRYALKQHNENKQTLLSILLLLSIILFIMALVLQLFFMMEGRD